MYEKRDAMIRNALFSSAISCCRVFSGTSLSPPGTYRHPIESGYRRRQHRAREWCPEGSQSVHPVLTIAQAPGRPMRPVVAGSRTHEGRRLALQTESRACFESSFAKAMKVRNWVPTELPLNELHRLRHRLRPEAVTKIQASVGAEEDIADSVRGGSEMFRDGRVRPNLQLAWGLAWGMEELEHGWARELVLLHPDQRTESQVNEYIEDVLSPNWTMRDNHPELDTHWVSCPTQWCRSERPTSTTTRCANESVRNTSCPSGHRRRNASAVARRVLRARLELLVGTRSLTMVSSWE